MHPSAHVPQDVEDQVKSHEVGAASPSYGGFPHYGQDVGRGDLGRPQVQNMLYGVKADPNAMSESLSLKVDPKAMMVLEKS